MSVCPDGDQSSKIMTSISDEPEGLSDVRSVTRDPRTGGWIVTIAIGAERREGCSATGVTELFRHGSDRGGYSLRLHTWSDTGNDAEP